MVEMPSSRRKWIKDLYIERSAQSKSCTTNPAGLALHGAEVELHLDGRLNDEDLNPIPFDHYAGTQQHLCRLIRIYLLPVLHQESSPRTLDVFLLLDRTPPVENKTNCYRRIGLMKLIMKRAKYGLGTRYLTAERNLKRKSFGCSKKLCKWYDK